MKRGYLKLNKKIVTKEELKNLIPLIISLEILLYSSLLKIFFAILSLKILTSLFL